MLFSKTSLTILFISFRSLKYIVIVMHFRIDVKVVLCYILIIRLKAAFLGMFIIITSSDERIGI